MVDPVDVDITIVVVTDTDIITTVTITMETTIQYAHRNRVVSMYNDNKYKNVSVFNSSSPWSLDPLLPFQAILCTELSMGKHE